MRNDGINSWPVKGSGPSAWMSARQSLRVILVLLAISLLALLAGCSEDDCINCVELPPPVVPTGVHSISGDGEIIVQWYDISYYPYDGAYNENVVTYYVYRYFDDFSHEPGFYIVGEVDWDQNFDPDSGLHWYVDRDVEFDTQYEYAVTAVNAAGRESDLSYEIVLDVPVHIGDVPIGLYNYNGSNPQWSGYDFSRMASGRTDPDAAGSTADIRVAYQGGVPYVHTTRPLDVKIQDFGVFTAEDDLGNEFLVFEGVSWAPEGGYSNTGVLELVIGHIYVVEIYDPTDGLHYAKFGVVGIGSDAVEIVWAYQTMEGMPELKAEPLTSDTDRDPVRTVSF